MRSKKVFLIPILISFFSIKLFSMDFNWDFGTVLFGGYTGFTKDYVESEMELNVQILDFRFETEDGFSISLSPLNCILFLDGKEHNDFPLSFINCSFAYDFFRFEKNIQLMPYLSLHVGAQSLKNSWADCGIAFNTFARSSGSQEGDVMESCNIDFDIFTAKAGVRLYQLRPDIYFDVGVNILLFILLFFGNGGKTE